MTTDKIQPSPNPDICWSCAAKLMEPFAPYCKNPDHPTKYFSTTPSSSIKFKRTIRCRLGYHRWYHHPSWSEFKEICLQCGEHKW